MAQTTDLWLPTRPYSLIDAINRMSAATGGVRNAQLAASAGYNGHNVSVYFNSFRKFWICEHYWGQRVVHSRGSYEDAIIAGRREYDRELRGTQVVARGLDESQAETAKGLGFVPYSEEIAATHRASWADDRYAQVNDALYWEKQMGAPSVMLLVNSTDATEYKTKMEEWFAERRKK